MEDVYSYLKWRGDLSLSESPFNEIDSLMLAMISYLDFDGIVPGMDSNDGIKLKEASEKYFSINKITVDSKKKLFADKLPMLLKEAADTDRYGKIEIGKHINQIDTQKEKQFSASTFVLGDGSIYVAYRGTDSTIVGWKEDFNLSFIPEVPAQSEAVKYLDAVSDWKCRSIRVGGHSKGGNLAVYAGIRCSGQNRDRILSVHNFDGPGFNFDVIKDAEACNMLSRITNYLPQASIIGMILEHAGENKIIRSSQFGIMQHDSFSWEVGATGFPCLKVLDKSSLMLDGIMRGWIGKLDAKERECFVDALFGVLKNMGIERVEDFTKVTNDKTKAFIKSINSMPAETRKLLSKAVRQFFTEGRKAVQTDLRNIKYNIINKRETVL